MALLASTRPTLPGDARQAGEHGGLGVDGSATDLTTVVAATKILSVSLILVPTSVTVMKCQRVHNCFHVQSRFTPLQLQTLPPSRTLAKKRVSHMARGTHSPPNHQHKLIKINISLTKNIYIYFSVFFF